MSTLKETEVGKNAIITLGNIRQPSHISEKVTWAQEAQKKAKDEQRRAEEQEKARESASKQNKGKGEKLKDKDPDPDGAQLAAVPDPLAEASKLLQVLRENHEGNLDTHGLSFEVHTAPFPDRFVLRQ